VKSQTDNESQDIGSVIIAVANRPRPTECRMDGGTMRSVGHAVTNRRSCLSCLHDSLCFLCSSAPKTIESDAASSNKPPMVIHNSDGTLRFKKNPRKRELKTLKRKRDSLYPPRLLFP
jgi:hypothetical protein